VRRARLVAVTWKDAHASDGVFQSKDHAPVTMLTVGWLLCRDANGVSLANERHEDGSYRGQSFIPAGMVKRVKTIPVKEGL
jgi:hypothetical protein